MSRQDATTCLTPLSLASFTKAKISSSLSFKKGKIGSTLNTVWTPIFETTSRESKSSLTLEPPGEKNFLNLSFNVRRLTSNTLSLCSRSKDKASSLITLFVTTSIGRFLSTKAFITLSLSLYLRFTG